MSPHNSTYKNNLLHSVRYVKCWTPRTWNPIHHGTFFGKKKSISFFITMLRHACQIQLYCHLLFSNKHWFFFATAYSNLFITRVWTTLQPRVSVCKYESVYHNNDSSNLQFHFQIWFLKIIFQSFLIVVYNKL